MSKILKIAIVLCFCTNIAYTLDDDDRYRYASGTYLSRICEYDVKNTIGFKESGNFIIKSEFISYYFEEYNNVKIIYRYIIKKILPSANNTYRDYSKFRKYDTITECTLLP
jgi:hypothetical protein